MFDLLTYDNEGRPRLTVTIENKNPTLAVFTAQNGIPPATNYATRDVRGLFPVLDFDNTTSESIYFVGVMPQQYQNNGMTAYVSGTSGVITIATFSIGNGIASNNLVAGDMFMVKLTRDVADTAAGDANFLSLELRGQ